MNYTARTYHCSQNGSHNKSWVLEGSRDKNSWTILDEETNCSYLNGSNFIHTFPVKNETENHSNIYDFAKQAQTGQIKHFHFSVALSFMVNCCKLLLIKDSRNICRTVNRTIINHSYYNNKLCYYSMLIFSRTKEKKFLMQ